MRRPSKRPAPRPTRALVARPEPSNALTPAQHKVLAEALRRGEDLREQVEASVTAYGRWLLSAVFDDDARAALDERTDNPLWLELRRRAGGPTLQVSRRMLYVALHLAAHDKRIPDQSWRGLDAGRKELLLPLATDDRLREAAHHVTKFNLSQASTKQYVAELRKAEGKAPAARITMPQLVTRVQRLRKSIGTPAVLRRVAELHEAADPSERAAAAEEIEQLRAVLADVVKRLRGRK